MNKNVIESAENRQRILIWWLDTEVRRLMCGYDGWFQEKMKGKNKLAPRLLGVTKDSVLRLDERTKEILKVWPLTTVRRWAASPNTFTLDFGDYSDQYYSVQTTEGEQISQLIAGYIDIILKKVFLLPTSLHSFLHLIFFPLVLFFFLFFLIRIIHIVSIVFINSSINIISHSLSTRVYYLYIDFSHHVCHLVFSIALEQLYCFMFFSVNWCSSISHPIFHLKCSMILITVTVIDYFKNYIE